jgi:hypothetical protein
VARAATRSGSDTTGWGRSRLLVILIAAVVVAAGLLGGVAYAGYLALTGVSDDPATSETATGESARSTVARGEERRDEIAASPMLQVPPDAAFPAEPTNRTIPAIEIPPGTGISGPGQVMTGFPQTPEGAIGQLAQIDIAVLQAMSLPTAEQVYATWALPGGVAADDWWVTANVKAFLSSTQMGQVKDPDAAIVVEPVAALVKGTDGPGWTTVCVLLKVSATYRQNGQVAFGHCERMQWVGGRWMLAPGPPPAPAPSTWPGTELARRAGWHMWLANDAGRSHDGNDRSRSQDR